MGPVAPRRRGRGRRGSLRLLCPGRAHSVVAATPAPQSPGDSTVARRNAAVARRLGSAEFLALLATAQSPGDSADPRRNRRVAQRLRYCFTNRSDHWQPELTSTV